MCSDSWGKAEQRSDIRSAGLKQRADVMALPSAPPVSHLFVFLERSAEPRAAKSGNKGAHPHATYGVEPQIHASNVSKCACKFVATRLSFHAVSGSVWAFGSSRGFKGTPAFALVCRQRFSAQLMWLPSSNKAGGLKWQHWANIRCL